MSKSPKPVGAPQNCPKCQGAMEQGYLLDSLGLAVRAVAAWRKGVPESGVLGVKAPIREVVKPLGAFRCAACGFVELYADGKYGAR